MGKVRLVSAVGMQGLGSDPRWCFYLNQPHPNGAEINQMVQNPPLKRPSENPDLLPTLHIVQKIANIPCSL